MAPLPRFRRSFATKIALFVGLPSVVVALAAVNLLRLPSPAQWVVVLVVLAAVGAHALALRLSLERALGRLGAAMERAERGEFIARAPPMGDDEVGHLAQKFNNMLSRITDMQVRQLDSEQEKEAMARELALMAEIEESRKRLEARVRDLSLLFDLTRSLNSTLETPELLKRITEKVGRALDVTQFAVLFLDESRGELVVAEAFGFPEGVDPRGQRFGANEGVTGVAVRTGQLQLVPNTAADPRYLHYKGLQPEDGAFLAVPLVHKAQVLGVLNFSRTAPGGFKQEEVDLLQAVADQAALALANARHHQKSVELSKTDPLTGTFNRRHLFEQLDHEFERARRFGSDLSLVMIDVDHFKIYNDRNGHPAGDEVLKAIAAALQRTVRKVDTVARYGGEEFAIILPRVRREEGFAVAEKLRRAIESVPFTHSDVLPSGRVTISVGLAHFPTDALDRVQLVARADSALYAAKNAGRNRVALYAENLLAKPGAGG